VHLVLYTCGLIRGPLGSEAVQGFFEIAPAIFEGAERATGCVSHMGQEVAGWPPATQSWTASGKFVAPRFYEAPGGADDETLATTLSVWRSLGDLRAFAYKGIHAEALKSRAVWFVEADTPQHVLWWIDMDRSPTWAEAAAKLEALHDRGPSAEAFSMAVHFPSG
jgi:hypothetical protein